ncbi:hypothetical protein ACOME3_004534 [Neoechinorhynchus agilis]
MSMGYEPSRQCIRKSLEKLQTSYVDLLLIHWPAASKANKFALSPCELRRETWQAMCEAKANGYCRFIGVSNFTPRHLQDIMSSAEKPSINQIELNPVYWDHNTLEFCRENGIAIQGYSVLGGYKKEYRKRIEESLKDFPRPGFSWAQLCLSWALQRHPYALSVLFTSTNSDHLKECVESIQFRLIDDEIKMVDGYFEGEHMTQSSKQTAEDSKRTKRVFTDAPPPKKKKSRWATPDQIATTDMPATIPSNLSKEHEQIYILHLQIQELSRRINVGDLGIPMNPEDRSPSPEPEYDSYGKRTNLREARARKKLKEERHRCIQKMMKLCPEYKPPIDYKTTAVRYTAKVDIPQEEYPQINFLGLIIGPRGNSLKSLERETGTKIIIRGKGANKTNREIVLSSNGIDEEPLHAYITAPDQELADGAAEKLREVIRTGIEDPESLSERRKNQLKELAVLNGTYRENDGLNRLKVLSEAEEIVTNRIVCGVCGGLGHLVLMVSLSNLDSDCLQKRDETAVPVTVDREYLALMTELGEDASASADLAALKGFSVNAAQISVTPSQALPRPAQQIYYPQYGHQSVYPYVDPSYGYMLAYPYAVTGYSQMNGQPTQFPPRSQ